MFDAYILQIELVSKVPRDICEWEANIKYKKLWIYAVAIEIFAFILCLIDLIAFELPFLRKTDVYSLTLFGKIAQSILFGIAAISLIVGTY